MSMILKIAVPTRLHEIFDYLPPKDNSIPLKIGQRVKIPWRNKNIIGVLWEISHETSVPINKLKYVEKILDVEPLIDKTMMKFITMAANYYHHPIGEVAFIYFTSALRKEKQPAIKLIENHKWEINSGSIKINAYQQAAITAINAVNNFQTYLIEGVTGSGKTEVYLQIIAPRLLEKKQALVLVPEIALTPQTFERFAQRFNAPIFMLHSGLGEKEKYNVWMQAYHAKAAIVIGTRSAVFTPLPKLGIIVIDEEHDLSFKQQSGFRYSSRDLAISRGQIQGVPVVLGSATPSLETYYNVEKQKYKYLSLPERASKHEMPILQIIDINKQTLQEGLSFPLIEKMREQLNLNHQVLLFLNRRGFAPLILCPQCKWSANCTRCDAKLTLHKQLKKLLCHHCQTTFKIPTTCQSCQQADLLHLGIGTERLELALEKLFPDVPIIRIDRDTVQRKGSLQEKLSAIQTGTRQILLGTQMLTKGHHFPELTLVGIINADYFLFNSDFRASERLGQLITQVAGRAGRGEVQGEVYIQTHFATHPLLNQLVQQGYQIFAQNLLLERKFGRLPPYSYLTLIRAEAGIKNFPYDFLNFVAQEVKKLSMQEIQVFGPISAPMEKKANLFRGQLYLHASHRKILASVLQNLLPKLRSSKDFSKVRWSIDVDPQEIV